MIQIKGKKDKHDLFIEGWLKKQKELAERAKMAVEEKRLEYRESLEKVGDSETEGSRLATPEEIANLGRKDIIGVQRGAFSQETYEKKQAFIKKVSSVVLKSDK